MTLRNLRIFLAVADCGSMSEAAKKMHIVAALCQRHNQ